MNNHARAAPPCCKRRLHTPAPRLQLGTAPRKEVVAHVEGLKDPLAQKGAITDMADILRHYAPARYGAKTDVELWHDLQSDLVTRKDFVAETVRQLSHYINENTNSETGYLKPLNADKYNGRSEFYKQKVFQVDLNEFGLQLRNRVRRVAEQAKAQNQVVP